MGCTSAKQVSAVPGGEEGQNKAYSNGDLLSGQSVHCSHTHSFFVTYLYVQVIFHFLNVAALTWGWTGLLRTMRYLAPSINVIHC